MKKWLFAILIGSALVLGACGGGDDGANDTGTDNGATVETAGAEEVYKDSCAACHGGDLTGGAGPNLTSIGAEYSADEIADIIENGKGQMQPQTGVNAEDRAEIAGWLAEKK